MLQQIDTRQEEVHEEGVTSEISEEEMRLRGLVDSEEQVVVGKTRLKKIRAP